MAKKATVKLRIYRGKILSYDQNGNVQNENQLVTLPHNTIEWMNYLDKMRLNQLLKVELVSACYVEKKKNEDGFFDDLVQKCSDEEFKGIEKEIENAFKMPEPEKTPEQKRIAELEAKLEKLLKASEPQKKESKPRGRKPQSTEK